MAIEYFIIKMYLRIYSQDYKLLFNKHIEFIYKKAYFSLNYIIRCIKYKNP